MECPPREATLKMEKYFFLKYAKFFTSLKMEEQFSKSEGGDIFAGAIENNFSSVHTYVCMYIRRWK